MVSSCGATARSQRLTRVHASMPPPSPLPSACLRSTAHHPPPATSRTSTTWWAGLGTGWRRGAGTGVRTAARLGRQAGAARWGARRQQAHASPFPTTHTHTHHFPVPGRLRGPRRSQPGDHLPAAGPEDRVPHPRAPHPVCLCVCVGVLVWVGGWGGALHPVHPVCGRHGGGRVGGRSRQWEERLTPCFPPHASPSRFPEATTRPPTSMRSSASASSAWSGWETRRHARAR